VTTARRAAVLFGLVWLVAFALLPPAPPLTALGMKRLGLIGFAIVWWIASPLPLAVTTMAALAGGVVIGALTLSEAFAAPTYWVMWFVIGAFGLSTALETTGFNRRFALAFLTGRWVRGHPHRFLFAFLFSAALLSGIMANTVISVVWLSLATTIYAFLRLEKGDSFAEATVLGIAWASNIGGVTTPVGTATNPVAIGMIAAATGVTVGFLAWTVIGSVTMLLLLATMYAMFELVVRPDASRIAQPETIAFLEGERRRLGPVSGAERWAVFYFGLAILLWFVPDLARFVTPDPVARLVSARLNLAIPALLLPVAMCLTPVRGEGRTVLTWEQWARGIDWGMVIFIGGVLGLGSALGAAETGVAAALEQSLAPVLGGLPEYGFVLLLSVAVTLVTGLTSNLVCVSIFVPLGVTLSSALGIGQPVAVGVVMGIGASLAYMLPSGSSTNAIVAGSGWLRIGVMLRQGLLLMALHSLVITFVTYPLAKAVLPASISGGALRVGPMDARDPP
jgi:sodium-dependent dicarboxylate transporter 2/3/5